MVIGCFYGDGDGERTEILQSSCNIKMSRTLKGVHDFPCKEHMRIEKRLCDSRVYFGIRVQNMFNFSFLFDITPKNKRREGV